MGAPNTQQLVTVAEMLAPRLLSEHQCGWFDGGCFTFAYAIQQVIGADASIAHISRTEQTVDHVVVYHAADNLYIDADGLQTRQALFTKMKTVELVDVTSIWPVDNIFDHPVYEDIALALIQNLKN